MYTTSFRGLLAYRVARDLSRTIFEKTKQFPKAETYALTDQIRRSSRSIGAQIAEAWAKRRYEKHFISKLTDADGEQLETQHWIETAVDCGYWSHEEASKLLSECQRIGQLIGGMIAKSEKFCDPKKSLKEPPVEYFVNSEP
ncbi:MAG: four helix bundle protein [Alphaproteobacteria bacterium]|nr:MAG: four helix bundle protein [Alphaproteobacteria bacterium]